MRKYWKVFLAVGICAAAAACITFIFIKKVYDQKNNAGNTGTGVNSEAGMFSKDKETLNLWYTDDSLTDYLSSTAVAYNDDHSDVRVVPKLVSAKDYISQISDASVSGTDMPDLFIIGNDTLEQATLGGLTTEVPSEDSDVFENKMPETAVDAVTYKDKIVGYPLYYETSSLLYNKTYLDDWAKAQVEAEDDKAAGESAQAADETVSEQAKTEDAASETADETTSDKSSETADETTSDKSFETTDEIAADEATQKKIDEKEAAALPSTISDIETFADTYDAPETMQAIFKWDVTDIFYNYFFIGASVNVGGKCGDDGTVDLYNSDSVKSMELYQNLNQFFSIDTSEISYDKVIQDFIDGKILYTVATTDAIASIDKAKADGKCIYDYGVTLLPAISKELPAKSLSVTSAVIVNGYCDHKSDAEKFASYLTKLPAKEFYERTGRVSVLKQKTYDNAALGAFMKEYERSAPIPKMLDTGSCWVKLEISFAKIWDGADPNDTLHSLSEEMITEVTGKKYEQDKIEVEDESTESSEQTDDGIESSEQTDDGTESSGQTGETSAE